MFAIEASRCAEARAAKDIEVDVFVGAPTNSGVAAELDLSR
jgi:hypothetical protein